MLLFLIILLVHLLYDFHWQGTFIADNKGKRPFLLGVHALTWAIAIWLPGYFLAGWLGWKLLFLYVAHFACDYWKSHQPRTDANFYLIYIDQGIHLLTLIAAVLL